MSITAKDDFVVIGWTGPRHLSIKVRSGGVDYYVPPDPGNSDYQAIVASGEPIPNAYGEAATYLPPLPSQTSGNVL